MQQKLVVATNPHRTVDHLGRPCCACPIDPRDPRFYDRAKARNAEVRGHVGAELKRDPAVLRAGEEKGDASDPSRRWDLTWRFRFASFELPDTRFYRARIKEGALLPVDQDTADKCGVVLVPVEDARALARKRAGAASGVDWIDPPPAVASATAPNESNQTEDPTALEQEI